MSVKKYRKNRRNRVIVLEELNFLWDEDELIELAEMWEQHKNIIEISNYFQRNKDELLLAILHLARTDKIKTRKGGFFGNINVRR